jgi:hypothetical protein
MSDKCHICGPVKHECPTVICAPCSMETIDRMSNTESDLRRRIYQLETEVSMLRSAMATAAYVEWIECKACR